jgi:AraC-like DNA-binding protein
LNFRFIRGIIERNKEVFPMALTDQEQQELRELRQAHSQLQQDYEQLQIRLRNFSKEAFLVDLLGSNRISQEEYAASLQEFQLNFTSEHFVVMGIEADLDVAGLLGSRAPINQESLRYVRFILRNVTEDLIGQKNTCYVVTMQGKLVGLICLREDPETAMESIAQAAQQGSELLEHHYDTIVRFSISQVHTGFREISAAYQEAVAMKQYRTMAGDDSRVLRYDLHTEHYVPKERVEHFEFEHTLGNLIRAGDYEAARELVHKMLGAEFGHTRPTVQVFMIRAYGIINDILHVFDSLEESFSPEFLVELQAGPRIVNATSLAEISRELDDIFDAIIARQQAEEQEPGWVQRAVDYMDDRFTDQNLNVASVAEAVGINPVYLSRMLKKYRSIRPLDYIHEKRIAKAKLLLSQGVTVKDTLGQVGYSSALTMNRAFRKFENTTPGAFYREKQS